MSNKKEFEDAMKRIDEQLEDDRRSRSQFRINKNENLNFEDDKKPGKEWFEEREDSIKKSIGITTKEADKIRINVTEEDIKNSIWREEHPNPDAESIIRTLKHKVYLDTLPDRKDLLLEAAREKAVEHDKKFEKLFWEEYVYDKELELDHKQLMRRAEDLNGIKEVLDKNPNLHGVEGSKQDVDDRFSWRAWGALMAAYMNSKEKDRKYDYMSFYMQWGT